MLPSGLGRLDLDLQDVEFGMPVAPDFGSCRESAEFHETLHMGHNLCPTLLPLVLEILRGGVVGTGHDPCRDDHGRVGGEFREEGEKARFVGLLRPPSGLLDVGQVQDRSVFVGGAHGVSFG